MATVSLLRCASPSLRPLAPLPRIHRPKAVAAARLSLPAINANESATFVNTPPATFRRPRQCRSAVCYASAAPLGPETLQWISAVSSAVLVLAKGTAIHKSFLVPLFALQAPASVISWIKGEYGIWTAFLALLVRLFYAIPGELELPFLAMLLVIVSPHQAMNLRGTQPGAIVSLAIAGYLAYQHFSRTGSLQRAFDQGSIIATLAIVCVTVVACFFLF